MMHLVLFHRLLSLFNSINAVIFLLLSNPQNIFSRLSFPSFFQGGVVAYRGGFLRHAGFCHPERSRRAYTSINAVISHLLCNS
jgi:hypothetical protein